MVDRVIIPATQPAEDPQHTQAMIDKVDQANQVPSEPAAGEAPPAEDKPGWLPEKFKSPEELAKAYAELEAKLGKPTQQNTEEKPADTQEQQVQEELQNKGLDLYEFSDEFASQGQLSDDSYSKLEKAGYPRDIVDQFIEGQKARASLFESEVKAVAGGDQGFTDMVQWAAANLSPAEIAAYNAAIDSGSPEQAKLAVAGVYQKYSASRPTEPKLRTGSTSQATSGDAYESVAQLTKDMASPEYKSDPAFRAKVQAKLARSSIL
jgi:Phage T7 capsid assembly protein